jgi:hypothetical protein
MSMKKGSKYHKAVRRDSKTYRNMNLIRQQLAGINTSEYGKRNY